MEQIHLGKFEHRSASHSLEHSAEQVDLRFVQVCGFEGNEPVGWYDKDGVLIADPSPNTPLSLAWLLPQWP